MFTSFIHAITGTKTLDPGLNPPEQIISASNALFQL